MRNVALDLGAKKIAYCEVSSGKVIDRATLSSLSSLAPMLGPQAEPARVAIEACREAWFVHSRLTEWGNEVLLVDTTRSRTMGIGHHRRKNDWIDAEVMALAVERGGIPLAHLLSPHRQELRRQLNIRRALVETRARSAKMPGRSRHSVRHPRKRLDRSIRVNGSARCRIAASTWWPCAGYTRRAKERFYQLHACQISVLDAYPVAEKASQIPDRVD